MKLPVQHLKHQVPALTTFARTLLASRKRVAGAGADPEGRLLDVILPPRDREHVRDYVRSVGGDPEAYASSVPPHLFCQWGLPLLARNLEGTRFPLSRFLNGGCRLEVHAPLPIASRLRVSVRLENVDENERRIVIRQRIVTGTDERPDCVAATMFAVMPKRQRDRDPSGGGASTERTRPTVAPTATAIDEWALGRDAGLEFALLTGDINPLHWVPLYARAMGFKNTILHGFSTMARAYESLAREVGNGEAGCIRTLDVKFVKPLVLPRRVGLYTRSKDLYVGDAPGAEAYMVGKFQEVSGE
jgi:acyl dehydratase